MLVLAAAISAESSGRAKADVHFFSVVEQRLVVAERAVSIKEQITTKAQQLVKTRRRRAALEDMNIPSEFVSTRQHLFFSKKWRRLKDHSLSPPLHREGALRKATAAVSSGAGSCDDDASVTLRPPVKNRILGGVEQTLCNKTMCGRTFF
jgi:hypothetical protein